MKKIIITGTSGSGKSTLGKILSKQLSISCTDLDDLFWLPNWAPRPHEEFMNLVEKTADQPSWIICGNQSKVRPLFWPKADTVIWLDLPFFLLFRRVFVRGLKQLHNRESICNGNRQTVRQFLWLVYWLCSSYRRRKRIYTALKKNTPHLEWIHLKNQKEVDSLIQKVKTKDIRFFPLQETDFPLIHHWFNQSHVQAFYSLRNWTLDEVKTKLNLETQRKKKIQCYIVHFNGEPIGYIQSYPIKDHPWENQNLPQKVVDQAAGIDLFIGDEEKLQKGLGSEILQCFLSEKIWPHYLYCVVDPDIKNEVSIGFFQKNGFKKHSLIHTKDALEQFVSLQLMVKEFICEL